MLQIAFYHARVSESVNPVEHVCKLLGISLTTFWRKYDCDSALRKAARDGGDGYYVSFAAGHSLAEIALLAKQLPDGEMGNAPCAWEAQVERFE
jgi:hypothetical protein